MRITKLWIKEYKNLKDFTWELNPKSPVAVIVGKNASGKTNLLEAILNIFVFLYIKRTKPSYQTQLDFEITYFIDDLFVTISYIDKQITVIEDGQVVKVSEISLDLPTNIFIYYSGLSQRFRDILRPFHQSYINQLRSTELLQNTRVLIDLPPPYYKFVLLSWLMGTIDKDFLEDKFNIDTNDFEATLIVGKPIWAKSDDISVNWNLPINLEVTLQQFLVNFDNEIIDLKNKKQGIKIKLKPLDVEKLAEFDYEVGLFEYLCDLSLSEVLKNINLRLKKKNINDYIRFEDLSEGEVQRIGIRGIMEVFRGEEILFLLDEPDTFAHPRWQWELVSDIEESLLMRDENENIEAIQDNAQAIFITHSPIVLSSLTEPAFIMEEGKIRQMNKTLGNTINETLAEQEVPYQKTELAQKLKTYIALIQEGEAQSEEAQTLRKELENKLGKEHPELQDADDLIALYE